MAPLPAEIDHRIRSELGSGEHLVWAGQPVPKRFMRSAIPAMLFSIPFLGFAIFWMTLASQMNDGFPRHDGFNVFSCFPLFGIPILIVGLLLLTSPYWMYRRALRTCYALTNQRAILWTAGWVSSVEVRSYTSDALTKISRREYEDGSGDLIFEEVITTTRDSGGHWRSHRTERGFIGIENVRHVEDLLRRTLLP